MAKLGTPENPEIIEPGRPRPTPGRAPARFGTTTKLLGALVAVVTPAVAFDWAALHLVRTGWLDQNPLAWLLALLLTPAAAVSTVVAIFGAPVILLMILLLAVGRPVSIYRR